MNKIYLEGALGEKYGTEHNIKVSSVGEAIRALEANYPGFRNSIKRDGEYAIFRDNKNIDIEDLPLEKKNASWTIMPVPTGSSGSGGNWLKIVVGVILVAVAYYYGGPAGGQAMGQFYFGMAMMGTGLIMSGVAGLLAPMPDMSSYDYGTRERPEERPSYLFSGTTNKTQGGHAIPVVYGEMFIGSTVISAGMRVEDVI